MIEDQRRAKDIKNTRKTHKKKQPCLQHLEKALQASEDNDDTLMVRVVGDGTIETKVSGVEGGTVS